MYPAPNPAIYVIDLEDAKENLFFSTKFICFFYFLKVHLNHFSKIKSYKKSHTSVGIMGFLTTFA
jgi:hypothetical protein